MTHSTVRGLFNQRIDAAKRMAAAASGISHLGLRGRARETFVNELLVPLLLPGQAVGTGVIVDSLGSQSNQTDVIVFDKTVLPPVLFNEQEGLYPIEACAYSIEIKSRLDRREIKASVETIKKLWALRPLVDVFRPVPVIFAFGSDLRRGDIENELRRYLQIDAKGTEHPAIRVICIVGKGYAFFEDRTMRQWEFLKNEGDNDDISNFLAGFANTLPDFRRNRTSIHLRFGEYLLEGSRKFARLVE
jgi:uncharacterized protein DUF6602